MSKTLTFFFLFASPSYLTGLGEESSLTLEELGSYDVMSDGSSYFSLSLLEYISVIFLAGFLNYTCF